MFHYQKFHPIGEPEIYHSSDNLKTIARKLTVSGEFEDYDFEVDLNGFGIRAVALAHQKEQNLHQRC